MIIVKKDYSKTAWILRKNGIDEDGIQDMIASAINKRYDAPEAPESYRDFFFDTLVIDKTEKAVKLALGEKSYNTTCWIPKSCLPVWEYAEEKDAEEYEIAPGAVYELDGKKYRVIRLYPAGMNHELPNAVLVAVKKDGTNGKKYVDWSLKFIENRMKKAEA